MLITILGVADRHLIIKPLEDGLLSLVISNRHGEQMECITLDVFTAMEAASSIELAVKYVEKYQAKKPVDIGTDCQAVNEVSKVET